LAKISMRLIRLLLVDFIRKAIACAAHGLDIVGKPKDIDIPKMLMQLFDDAQMYNKSYDHMIHLHIDSTLHILGYEDYLRSALSNLITNAMKYTPKGGEISISWHEYDAGVCFSVTDNGIGIEQRHIQRLTERFYRVDTGRSRGDNIDEKAGCE
jgi:two-component system, OmpR family, phosphate regulon sensor histidine kinase PhoR